MNWTQVNIYTTTQGIEPVAFELLSLGITGYTVTDSNDFKEFLENKNGQWDYIDDDLMGLSDCETYVTAYIPENEQGSETLKMLIANIARLKMRDENAEFGRLEIELDGVKEEDWANNWKQYYHTQRIGKRIVVTPSWEEYTPNGDDVQMRLDPGMAFGTGTHDTTRLCLELLEECVTPSTRILDVGTGSGILSVGGVLLGAPSALGVDIDPVAVKVANENAEINEVSGKTEFVCGDLTDKVHGKFEIVTANIVADVIIRLLSTVKNYLLKGGVLIVSGIIDTRADEVENACHEAGFVTEKRLEHGGWVAIKLRY